MSCTVTFTCDRCQKAIAPANASQPNISPLFDVAIGVILNRSSYYGNDIPKHTIQHKAEWCDNCCREVGILPKPAGPMPTAEQPKPSLEDMIREIAGEAGTEAALDVIRRQ